MPSARSQWNRPTSNHDREGIDDRLFEFDVELVGMFGGQKSHFATKFEVEVHQLAAFTRARAIGHDHIR